MMVSYTEPVSTIVWSSSTSLLFCLTMVTVLLFTSVGAAFAGVLVFYASAGAEINQIKSYWDRDVEYVSNILTAADLLLAGCVLTSFCPVGFRLMQRFNTKWNLLLMLTMIWLVIFQVCFALAAGSLAYIHGQTGTYYNGALRSSITEGIQRLDALALKFQGPDAARAVRDLINLNMAYECCTLNEYFGGAPSNDPTRCWHQKDTPCSSIIGDVVSAQARLLGVFGLIMGFTPIILTVFGSILAIADYVCDFKIAWCLFERDTPPDDESKVAGRTRTDFSYATASETDNLLSSALLSKTDNLQLQSSTRLIPHDSSALTPTAAGV